MTKEKILEKMFGNYAYKFGGATTIDIYTVMDEYAKYQAIEFQKYYDQHAEDINPATGRYYTTKQQYDNFLKSQL